MGITLVGMAEGTQHPVCGRHRSLIGLGKLIMLNLQVAMAAATIKGGHINKADTEGTDKVGSPGSVRLRIQNKAMNAYIM